jgi:hypothetical protein
MIWWADMAKSTPEAVRAELQAELDKVYDPANLQLIHDGRAMGGYPVEASSFRGHISPHYQMHDLALDIWVTHRPSFPDARQAMQALRVRFGDAIAMFEPLDDECMSLVQVLTPWEALKAGVRTVVELV